VETFALLLEGEGVMRSMTDEGEEWLAKPTKSASGAFRTMNALSQSEGRGKRKSGASRATFSLPGEGNIG